MAATRSGPIGNGRRLRVAHHGWPGQQPAGWDAPGRRLPAGITVMANGVLDSRTTARGRTTWVWRSTSPMAPSLATATLGRFDLTRFTAPGGIPAYVAVDPTNTPAREAHVLVGPVCRVGRAARTSMSGSR